MFNIKHPERLDSSEDEEEYSTPKNMSFNSSSMSLANSPTSSANEANEANGADELTDTSDHEVDLHLSDHYRRELCEMVENLRRGGR